MQTRIQLAVVLLSMMHEIVSAQTDCGITSFPGTNGIVTSPNFPLPYPHDIFCTYSIEVGRNNSVSLQFLIFELESADSSTNCQYDWLRITCSETTAHEEQNFNRKYCGQELRASSLRFFDCAVVTLEFFADRSINRGGFKIAYTVVENSTSTNISDLDCGDTLFTNSSGFISLPTNPTYFPARLNCTYVISANVTSRILLSIASFQLRQLAGSFRDCDVDNITIGCVSLDRETELNLSTLRTYCSQRLPPISLANPVIVAFSNCRTVKMSVRSSDYNYQGTFSLSYTVSADGDECGNTFFTGPTGVITTPQIALSYSQGVECVYTIDVNRTQTILLRFLSFNIRRSYLDDYEDCENEGLTISCRSRDPMSAIPVRDRIFCGDTSPPSTLIYSNCDYLRLSFISNTGLAIIEPGFQLRYTIMPSGTLPPDIPDEDCGRTFFTGPTGVITSPKFPLSYPHSLNCVYSIDIDRTKTVLLNSLSFHLEGTSQHPYSDSCSYDWITITCLSNRTVSRIPSPNRKYCGEKLTPLILRYSNCDSLTLNFVTDSSVTKDGFQLRYTLIPSGEPDCGNTLFSGPSGVITSPNVPLPYPLNLSCVYSIDVGPNKSVLLKFAYFDLEKPDAEGDCVNEWLMITCNKTTEQQNPSNNRKYCGSIQWRSPLRFLNCPSVVLKFSGSSSSINSTGFIIDYTVVENSESMNNDSSELDCGNILFTNSSGVISFPRNPTNYLATVNCTYTISTSDTSTFLLDTQFWQMLQLLQSFQDCKRENITVGCYSEGETRPNPNTTRVFCNRVTPTTSFPLSYDIRSRVAPMLFADCHTLKLSVRSMHYDFRETTIISYSAFGSKEECGNTSFSASSGVISSQRLPWFYQKAVSCLYTIDGGHVKSVVLRLDHFYLRSTYYSSGSCDHDWLTISCLVNGTTVAHPSAGKKLCGMLNKVIIRFPGCSVVLLNYYNEPATDYTAFTLRYRMGDYDEVCGNTSFVGPAGVIASPRFPLSYPHDLNCMYSIVGSSRSVIVLSFLTFQLQGTSNSPAADHCYSDWLTITCLSDESEATTASLSKTYCGVKQTPLRFVFSNCPAVVLSFVTDGSVNHGGFRLHYIIRDTDSLCGARFHDRPSGTINFPWNYTNYGDSFDCNYVINATGHSSISLTVWSISLQGLVAENCQRDWIQISCVSGQTSLSHNVSHSSCNNLTSSTQTTFFSCAAVEVVFHKNDTATGKTFLVEYTITENAEETSQPLAISVSTELPFTRSAECQFGCKLREDGINCDCTTTTNSSVGPVVNTQTSFSGNLGRSVAISVVVIFAVVVAVGLAVLLLYRRHRTKHRSEMLLPASEGETADQEFENDNTDAETLFAASRSEDRDTSRYVPLRSLSPAQFSDEMQLSVCNESYSPS